MLTKNFMWHEPVYPGKRNARNLHTYFPATRSSNATLFSSACFSLLALFALIACCKTHAMQDAICGPIFSTPEQTIGIDVSLSAPSNSTQPLTRRSPSIPLMMLTDETGACMPLLEPTIDALTILDTNRQLTPAEPADAYDSSALNQDIEALTHMTDLTLMDLQNLEAIQKSVAATQTITGMGTLACCATAWTLMKKFPLTAPTPTYRSRPSSQKSLISHVLHFIVDQFGYVAGIGTGVVGSVAYYKLKAYFVDPLESEYQQQLVELATKLDTYEQASKARLEDHKRKITAQQKEHEQEVSDTLEKHARKTTAQLADHKHAIATELTEFEKETTKRQENQEKKLTKQLDEHKEQTTQTTEQARRNALEALLTAEKLEKRVGKTKEKDEAASRLTISIATLDAQAALLQELACSMQLSPDQQEQCSQQLSAVKANLENARIMLEPEPSRRGIFGKLFKSRRNSLPGPLSTTSSRRSSISDYSEASAPISQEPCRPKSGRRSSLVPDNGLSSLPEVAQETSPREGTSPK